MDHKFDSDTGYFSTNYKSKICHALSDKMRSKGDYLNFELFCFK